MSETMDSDAPAFRCRDGGLLHYSTAGDGEPVVLIHGFSLDSAMWDSQWPALTEHHRVVRYDLRGYGRSSIPEGPYTHAADLLALMQHLHAQPAHLVGMSMGGGVALALTLEQPAAVRSLTLVDTVLDGFRMSETWAQRWRAVVATGKAGDLREAKRQWLAHELFASAGARPDVAAALEAMMARYSGWHWGHTDPGGASPRRAIELLATVSVPTLVIVGEHDLPDFQAIARRLATDIPQARLEVIAGAGHMANMEAPAAVNELLLSHCGSREARRR